MVSTPSLTQGGFFYPAFMLSSDLATLHPLPEQHMQMFSSSLFWIYIEFKIFLGGGGVGGWSRLPSFIWQETSQHLTAVLWITQ